MPSITLTQSQARRFLLAYQMLRPPRLLKGKEGILEYFHRVRCVHFDPLDRAGQNADLVLQSRISDYKSIQLRELLYQDRKLLDGYDKNMAIYPIEDWPYFKRMRDGTNGRLRSSEAVKAIIPQILTAIETHGPLSSSDFKFNQTVDWYWSPTSLARAALESLYFSGELVIHRKIHTRKVYDLAQRHIPDDLWESPEPNQAEADYIDWFVLRRIGSIGLLWNLGTEAWLGVPAKSAQRRSSIRRLIEAGKLKEVDVEGLETPMYVRTQDIGLLNHVLDHQQEMSQMAFIAPLDNLMWDRRLLKDLFNFKYRWEVYTPQVQRAYGYYVLPVLYGDQFIARFEPICDRKNRQLSIKNWWWEPGIIPTLDMGIALKECLEYFCSYLNITKIESGEYTARSTDMSSMVNFIMNI